MLAANTLRRTAILGCIPCRVCIRVRCKYDPAGSQLASSGNALRYGSSEMEGLPDQARSAQNVLGVQEWDQCHDIRCLRFFPHFLPRGIAQILHWHGSTTIPDRLGQEEKVTLYLFGSTDGHYILVGGNLTPALIDGLVEGVVLCGRFLSHTMAWTGCSGLIRAQEIWSCGLP